MGNNNKQAVINTGVGVAATFCGSYIKDESYVAKDRRTGKLIEIDSSIDL